MVVAFVIIIIFLKIVLAGIRQGVKAYQACFNSYKYFKKDEYEDTDLVCNIILYIISTLNLLFNIPCFKKWLNKKEFKINGYPGHLVVSLIISIMDTIVSSIRFNLNPDFHECKKICKNTIDGIHWPLIICSGLITIIQVSRLIYI